MKTNEKINYNYIFLVFIFIVGCNELKNTDTKKNEEEKKITFIYSESGDTATILVKEINNNLIFEGDMIVYEMHDLLLNRNDIDTLNIDSLDITPYSVGVQRRFRWYNGIIPFKIQDDHPYDSLIRDAMSEIESLTNICFKETNIGRYVNIEWGENLNCWSTIGDPTFSFVNYQVPARITLGPSCGTKSVILHELCHTIGLYHEHTRYDRDSFVNILWENIQSDRVGDFEKRNWYHAKDIHAYDCSSLMHYRPTQAGISENGVTKTTIQNINCTVPFGQQNSLSAGDIQGINSMYYWVTGCAQRLDSNIEDTIWHIIAKHSGKVLSLETPSKNNRINIVQSNPSNYQKKYADSQRFKIIPAGDDFYYIQNIYSQKYLTIDGAATRMECDPHSVSSTEQSFARLPQNVIQLEKYSDPCLRRTQKWKFIQNNDQSYSILSQVVSNYNYHSWYLDVVGGSEKSGADVAVWKNKSEDNQKFILKAAPPDPICNATFISQSVPDSLNSLNEITVSMTFRNTGNTTWSSEYRLLPIYKGFNVIPITVDKAVLPGEEITFSFPVSFPNPGIYKFQWSMDRFAICGGNFGRKSELAEILVNNNTDCDAIMNQIELKKTEKVLLQQLLETLIGQQKAVAIRSIVKVGGEIIALKKLAEEKGCI